MVNLLKMVGWGEGGCWYLGCDNISLKESKSYLVINFMLGNLSFQAFYFDPFCFCFYLLFSKIGLFW